MVGYRLRDLNCEAWANASNLLYVSSGMTHYVCRTPAQLEDAADARKMRFTADGFLVK